MAGYDLGKLVCGSRGRLGLIARVSLRLHPLPAARGSLVVETGDAARCRARAPRLAAAAERARRPAPGARGRAVRGLGARGRLPARDGAERSSAGWWPDDDVWDEARERQGRALGRVRFAPGDLANTLSTLGEAVVRVAAGVAYVPHRVGGVPSPAVRRLTRALEEQLDPAVLAALDAQRTLAATAAPC